MANFSKIILPIEHLKSFLTLKLPFIIGETGVKHFENSFTKEGFQHKSLRKWKRKKKFRNKYQSDKRILFRTGALSRSIRFRVNGKEVIIYSNSNYSNYHNAGTSDIVARPFIGKSDVLDRKIQKSIRKAFYEITK